MLTGIFPGRVVALALTAGIILTAGCGRRESRVESGIRNQVLHVGNGTEPQDLDPQTVTGVPEDNIIKALLEGLVSEDPKDLHPVPGVAKSWDISADGRVYTFHLRDNARWSNGAPVTATDFVRSYQRMLTPSLGSEYAYMLFYVVGAENYNRGKLTDFSKVGFKALDPHTLQISLNYPVPFFLNLLNHYSWFPVPIPTIEKFGGLKTKGTAWTRAGNYVGNGPFVLKKWVPNQEIVVAKNPYYWDRDRVRLKEIHFYPIESQDTEERMFRAGQLHMTYEMPQSKIDVYRRQRPDVLHIDPYCGVYFYRINVTKPPLNNPKVRRALALAIDRESLVNNVTRGGQLPAYNFTPPNTAGYTCRTPIEGTIADAKRLLAEAGFPGGKGFPHMELLYNTSDINKPVAEAIQEMWKRNLNIDVSLVNQEWKVYLDAQDMLNYQICRAGWIADYLDPHVFLEIFETGGGNNDTGWSNPEYDRLLHASLDAKSEAERYEIYQKMEAILLREMPVIPLYFYTHVNLVLPCVKGYYPTLLDHHPYKYMYLEQPASRQTAP